MKINLRSFSWLFVSIAVALTSLGVLELGLRIFYSRELSGLCSVNSCLQNLIWKTPRLFKKNGAGLFVTNDDPFFATRSQKQQFRMPKEKGTYRIFCIGGSTVQGSPYAIHDVHPEKAFPARLEQELRKRYPRVEVINAGIGAVSSGPLVGLASELTAYEPDLVILYAGHNEYGYYYWSEEALRISPLFFKVDSMLKDLYLYRAVLKIFNRAIQNSRWDVSRGWAKYDKEQYNSAGPSGREEIYRKFRNLIPDKEWQRFSRRELYLCARVFQNNVLEMDRRLKNSGIKFMVCTIVSNLRDFPPFVSFHSPGFNSRQLSQWGKLYDSAVKSLELGYYKDAINGFSRSLQMDNGYAEAHFLLARAYYGISDYDQARRHFILARDLSPAYAPKQRAPSSLNRLIRFLCREHGIYLCDIEQSYYDRKDNHGIAGDDLFWDNLHPNEEGYKYIGRLLADQIEKEHLIP